MLTAYLRELASATRQGWNRFWFTPADPATLGLIRLLAGAMLFYTHLVWTLELPAFFGPEGWLSQEAVERFFRSLADPEAGRARSYAWSYFWLLDSPAALWGAHLAALAVFGLLTLGWHSRVMAVAAYLCAVSYVNRVPAALFGLDQINVLLAMYLMLGPSGDAYSLDRWLKRRRAGGKLAPAAPSVGANVAVRLIQLHMCVIYLFAGLSKLSGGVGSWWEGSALWLAFGNLEYQSLDMTWLAAWPLVINFLTHLTVAWEISYSALVWPRLTRPIVLALAVPLHLGIAVCLGMITFGLVMLIANLAFVPPHVVRASIDGLWRLPRRRRTLDAVPLMPQPSTAVRREKPRKSARKR